jgi:hypothetical protein
MSRKQLFVDWNTLNQLIYNKDNKVIAMPANELWDNAGNQQKHIFVPGWADNDLLSNIEEIVSERAKDSRERMARPDEQEYQNSESQIAAAFTVEMVKGEKTVVVLVVRDVKHPKNNKHKRIQCQDGTGFCGYVLDLASDSYIVECLEFISLGNVHASYTLTMPNTAGWKMQIPMPESVIERLISPYHKRVLVQTREKYPRPDYELHFMQMIGCD